MKEWQKSEGVKCDSEALVAVITYGLLEFRKKFFKMVHSSLQIESWANKLRGKM
jgi:hypothetical protein